MFSVNKSLTLSEADHIAVRVLTGIHISLAAETGTSSSTNAICELWHRARNRTDEQLGTPSVCVWVSVCLCLSVCFCDIVNKNELIADKIHKQISELSQREHVWDSLI